MTTFPPGGGTLNEYGYHFVRFLRQKEEVAEVILLVDELPDGPAYPADAPASATEAALRYVACWRFGARDNAWRIRKQVQSLGPDAVLFNIQFASFGGDKLSGALGLLTPLLCKRLGVPTIVLLHNIMETVDLKSAGYASNPIMEGIMRFSGTILTRLILAADLVALTIPKYVEVLENKYRARNIVLAPHGSFDESVSAPDHTLPAGPRQIMTFGKFGTYKKVETLIEAFKLLATPERPPLELVIAGSDSPNAAGYLDAVQATVADRPDIRFTGYVAEEDVPHIFGDAAVVVFPYTSTTGSSGVLHQAGSYSKAAVLPNIGDFAEVIKEEGYDGEFFEPADVASMAGAIARVIDDDRRRQELGARNFAASQGLPIADVVDWYLLHLENLLPRSARPQSVRQESSMQGALP
ncbi:MAG: glycosyltransferase [Anaerolineales bacterium]|nr:glycosyltransferase [Anaerolineales bacterium]